MGLKVYPTPLEVLVRNQEIYLVMSGTRTGPCWPVAAFISEAAAIAYLKAHYPYNHAYQCYKDAWVERSVLEPADEENQVTIEETSNGT